MEAADNDPKKHRKQKVTNPNVSNIGSGDIQILVKEPKNKNNSVAKQEFKKRQEESLKKQESLKEIQELPDQENPIPSNNMSNFEQMQAMQTLQAQQMMQQMNSYQNNPNNQKNQQQELELMHRELRRQREEMEDTIGALRKQTNSVQQDSAKHQNDMAQLKMQIDMSKEKEMLIKQMYDVSMTTMKNEIEV